MFIYLSKKIAIPNNTKLNSLAWNREDGYIAVGGENGLLKVLKLDAGEYETSSRSRGLTATSNLSMNQTLEGHTENIQVITWNESHKKLTTSDQNGVIIVWMIYKNAWYEEMINNRKKSTVVGMTWSSDGQKICIIYEDGAVIVGSVDGNRIWGKELKGILLSGVQWSPDGKFLLFSLRNGEVHLYDNQGNFTMRLDIQCHRQNNDQVSIVGLDWYDGRHGYVNTDAPTLAVCYENGRLQLMRNESDTNAVIVDSGMNAVHCRWNHNGSMLAITGYQYDRDRLTNMVQFYEPAGHHIRTLKVPGKSISCCEWEAGSLRVALAVDSFVYFANIRPDYKWCYLKKTVVYMSTKAQKSGVCVSFWDTTNNQCHTRHVPSLLALAACGEYCLLAVQSDIDDESAGKYGLLLCNTLGIPVDGKYTDVQPTFAAMNNNHVVVASKDYFLLWQYGTPKNMSSGVSGNKGRFRVYHIDDSPSGAMDVLQELEGDTEEQTAGEPSSDPICCVSCTDKWLVLGRESGCLQQYVLPHVALVGKHRLTSRPHRLAINCDGTRCAVLDVSGVLTAVELSHVSNDLPPTSTTSQPRLERKDVWDLCWATDNPHLLAIMEKTRMYVLKGAYPEEPIATSGYICCFQELEITSVLLDDVVDRTDGPTKDQLIRLEVKSLRDTKQLLEKVGVSEAAQFVEDNPHPRLWRLLGQAAVTRTDLAMAEAAFIRSLDYPAVQFIKRLHETVTNDSLRKPLIAAHFNQFEEAEKAFLECDRRDLALTLRRTLGDWFRVVQLMKMGVQGNDIQFENAWNSIGYYFYHRQNWEGAKEYFKKARNNEMLSNCYYKLEEYDALEALIASVDEQQLLLSKIARMFASVGRCSAAVAAYLKTGDLRATVALCIKQNQWDEAVALAKQAGLPQLPELLAQYADHLIGSNALGKAVQLFHKANRHMDAVRIVHRLIRHVSGKRSNDPLTIKRLYVYAALLVETHLNGRADYSNNTQTIDELEMTQSAWRGAAAFHLLFLAHTHLYAGRPHDALITTLKLTDYDDIIPSQQIYCLLALASSLDRSFGICSKAFIKLESSDESLVSKYQELAVSIFTKHGIKDYNVNKTECYNCESLIPDWTWSCTVCFTEFPTCMISGRPLMESARVWTCCTCHHSCHERDILPYKNCPLCHSNIHT